MIWDNHVCLPFSPSEKWMNEILRHKKSGFEVISLNVGDGKNTLDDIRRNVCNFKSIINSRNDIVLCRDYNSVRLAVEEGRLAVIFDVEGLHVISDDLQSLDELYELGVRWASIAYNRANNVGGGCHELDRGLTNFGKDAIEHMDRIGLVKCVSHTGYWTSLDILNCTDKPTIFSHSNAFSICNHQRNISDEQIKACANTGGVIGVNGVSIFLNENEPRNLKKSYVDHITYIVDLVGVEHVGLSLDYIYDQVGLKANLENNDSVWPAGLRYDEEIEFIKPEELDSIRDLLFKRGFSESEIKKIYGGNWERIARQVWV